MSFTRSSDPNKTRRVDSLEEMELIVGDRPDLFWDGWNVLKFGDRSSILNPRARKVNGQWRVVNRYPLDEGGWELPVGLVGHDLAT